MNIFYATSAAGLLALYVILGLASLEPTRQVLAEQCQPPITNPAAHIAVWPISVFAAQGLRSRC